MYNWQLPDWPDFRFDETGLIERALLFAQQTGQSAGRYALLPADTRQEVLLDVLVNEALQTSAIEGEFISRQDVFSSIKRNLGFSTDAHRPTDKRAEGMANLLTTARATYGDALSEEMLFQWHTLLMQGSWGIRAGGWRSHAEPMQVISGSIGNERIHFEAPPSAQVPAEIARFIRWFNATAPNQPDAIVNPLVRASIAHLYFESIHPFEDGNGRIGRVIVEKSLAQSMDQPMLMSLSRTIDSDKKRYYEALQQGQQTNDLTAWMLYFSEVILTAQGDFQATVRFVIQRTRFFDSHKNVLNDRQQRVLSRMFAEGPGGFVGGMNARKYVSISKVSKATATRDLQDLVEKQLLVSIGSGRSSRYELNPDLATDKG